MGVTMKVLVLLFLVGSAYSGVPSCTTVWEEKCWDEPRQKCDTVKVPHEVTSYEQKWTTSQEKSAILYRFPGPNLFQRRSVKKYLKRSVRLNMNKNVTQRMKRNVTPNTPRNARLSMRKSATLNMRRFAMKNSAMICLTWRTAGLSRKR